MKEQRIRGGQGEESTYSGQTRDETMEHERYPCLGNECVRERNPVGREGANGPIDDERKGKPEVDLYKDLQNDSLD